MRYDKCLRMFMSRRKNRMVRGVIEQSSSYLLSQSYVVPYLHREFDIVPILSRSCFGHSFDCHYHAKKRCYNYVAILICVSTEAFFFNNFQNS